MIRTFLLPHTGYTNLSLSLGKALIDLGLDVRYDATYKFIGEDKAPLPDWVRDRLAAPKKHEPLLFLDTPGEPIDKDHPTVAFSMWEAAGLKPAWVRIFNQCEVVLVPCRHNAIAFSAAGVRAALGVVPLGIDTATFHPTGRADFTRADRPFRVGLAGRMNHGGVRKGIVEAIVAFRKAFPGQTDVSLEIKCLEDDPVPDFGDKRIRIYRDWWPAETIADWYRSLDLFLSGSLGEGWGLHLLEALACGTPIASVIWSGEADYLNSQCAFPLPCVLKPGEGIYAGTGVMAYPTEDGMIEALRRAYHEPETLRAMSEIGATRAAKFTWANSATALVGAIRPFLG